MGSQGDGIAVIDTSFLLALHKEEDHFHGEAVAVRFAGERLIVPYEIWVEFLQVLGRSVPSAVADAIIERILDGPFEIRAFLSAEELAEAFQLGARCQRELHRAGFAPLTVFDLVVCRVAARLRESVLTFDEGMAYALRKRMFPGARLT